MQSNRPVAGTAGPKQLRRLLDAVLKISSSLDLDDVLQTIVDTATELLGAQYGALGVLDETGTHLTSFVLTGMSEEVMAGIAEPPKGRGLLGTVVSDPRPLRLADMAEHPDSFGFPAGHPPMRTFLGVPIRVRDQIFGNLYLTEKADEEVFTDVDEELAVGFAAAAGIAIENARLHAAAARVSVYEDRERIARDLHDTVIQQLFAAGLRLQGLAASADAPRVSERLVEVIDTLDDTIRNLRSFIFDLETTKASASGLRREILRIASEAARILGVEPRVHFDGLIDNAIDRDAQDAVVAVVREALSNVAKHAAATEVTVRLAADGEMMTVEVADNGRGGASDGRGGKGLGNMRARAEHLGGSCTVGAGADGVGTRVSWSIPLNA